MVCSLLKNYHATYKNVLMQLVGFYTLLDLIYNEY